MGLYALLFVLFIVQEPVSTDAALLEAYQYHYNLWIIHALFVVAAIIDILIGYAIGAWLRKRYSENPTMHRLVDWTHKLSNAAGVFGEYAFYVVAGPMLFPVLAVIAPWLDISLTKTLIFLFLSDLILWYGSEWLIVLGVKSIIPDPIGALFGVVFVALLLALVMKGRQKRGQ